MQQYCSFKCHLKIYSKNTPTLFFGYTNTYLLQDYVDILFGIHNKFTNLGSHDCERLWQPMLESWVANKSKAYIE